MPPSSRQQFPSGETGKAMFSYDLAIRPPEERLLCIASSIQTELERHHRFMEEMLMHSRVQYPKAIK